MARTNEEAKKLIESLMEIQEDKTQDYVFPCPRCGHDRMKTPAVKNALSRRANIYICSECGTDEAILDAAGKEPVPFNQWGMVLGFDSEDDEPLFDEQACRICGCTWDNACEGGCYWVEDDLCSRCGTTRYYLTQRPPSPGTFPGTPIGMATFEKKKYVEEIGRQAWGWVEYQEPLTEKQADEYELSRPMKFNIIDLATNEIIATVKGKGAADREFVDLQKKHPEKKLWLGISNGKERRE